MFRRKKKKSTTANGSQPEPVPSTPFSDPVAPSPVTPDVHLNTKPCPVLSDALKDAFEKAADWPKTQLASGGKIKPKALFVYPEGTVRAVSLSFKDEFHKELLKHRIKEKALAENALAVIILANGDSDKNSVVLSGATPGIKASAYVDYAFDEESKTITSRVIHWLNQPIQDDFLDGIFETNP
jgi:hypothetical protein